MAISFPMPLARSSPAAPIDDPTARYASTLRARPEGRAATTETAGVEVGTVASHGRMAAARRFVPRRTIVLVGLMGAGKTRVGRRLAARLDLPFSDSDVEIEAAAGETIEEIFANRGEHVFRDGERRVIARLLARPPHVMATGGGAFMEPLTRALIVRRGVSVWLRADLDVLVERVSRRTDRPLLKAGDPRAILAGLMQRRDPIYAEADLVIDSSDGPPERTVSRTIAALAACALVFAPPDPERCP
jgi:shikimate kinase